MTVVLLATYVAVVLILQGPLGAMFGTQTVTVAISTLVIAGLFQPVRSRIQRAVDRRFDRARVDTERTAAAFSDRLRDEVDIDAVDRRPRGHGVGGGQACERHGVAARARGSFLIRTRGVVTMSERPPGSIVT